MQGSTYAGDGSLASVRCRSGDQREAVQDLPQMHHLSRDELREREPDDVYSPVDVGDDAPHLGAREPVRFHAETEHDLVAVDRVDVEVDDDTRAAVTAIQSSRG